MQDGYSVSPGGGQVASIADYSLISSYKPSAPHKTLETRTGKHQDREATRKELLTGYVARRSCGKVEEVIWDTLLPGFGLRRYPSGRKRWIVRFVERNKARVLTIGPPEEIDVNSARRLARERLQQVAVLGLPTRPAKLAGAKRIPTFAEVCEEFGEYRPYNWKGSTEQRNWAGIRRVLIPEFGALPIDAIGKEHVLRWRDSMVARQGIFNREVPTLSAVFQFAESRRYRSEGSNPTRGTPRYPRDPIQRFLTTGEYARLHRRLADHPDRSATIAIRILIHTGARQGEICNLTWNEVCGRRLALADSKTGRKIILLSDVAVSILRGLERGEPDQLVFTANGGTALNLSRFWLKFRLFAGLPDVRLHDLRHSYASIAIQNSVNLEAIGRLLGHALPETAERYAHLDDGCIMEAAERVGASIAAMLGGRP